MDIPNCTCGGRLSECKLNTNIYPPSVDVSNGYDFPKRYQIKAYLCNECGRVFLYADIEKAKSKA